MKSDHFCLKHINVPTFKGRVCPRCHPNCTVLGVSRIDIQMLGLGHRPTYHYIYSIQNGCVTNNPGPEAVASNIEHGELFSMCIIHDGLYC